MTLIDDILDAVTDPETGLWNALDATYTAAHHLQVATDRRNGSIGAERVYRRAQDEVESAGELVSALDDPFRDLFDVLLSVFHVLDAYRYAAADESQDRYAADHLDYVEDEARKALAKVLAGELVTAERVAA
jgi:hypothetical protein